MHNVTSALAHAQQIPPHAKVVIALEADENSTLVGLVMAAMWYLKTVLKGSGNAPVQTAELAYRLAACNIWEVTCKLFVRNILSSSRHRF